MMKVTLMMEDQENAPSHKGYLNKLWSPKGQFGCLTERIGLLIETVR
jgi:hypothetical protein